MKISQLEYFLAATRTLNYTQAANRMFTSRQNVSHAVKELERELGVRLFAQNGNSLVLTLEGEEAARRASTILNEIDKLKSAFTKTGTPADPLRVLVGSNIFTFSPYDISELLGSMSPEHYRLGELNCRECYEEVLAGRSDIALIACMERAFPECTAIPLHKDYLYLLVGENTPLTRKHELNLPDLMQYQLQAPPGYEFQLEPLVRMLKQKHAIADRIAPIASFSYVARKAAHGEALGIASATLKDASPVGTKVIPFTEPGTEMYLYALYRTGSAKTSAIKAFIDTVSSSLFGGKTPSTF